MLKHLLLIASLAAATAHAALPQRMELVYDLYRNGHRLGQVSDSFSRKGNRYTLVSETRADGALKLFWPGTIRLESRGIVTAQGLRPERFEHARSDSPEKRAVAQLDWKRHLVAYQYKGKSWQVNGLQVGTQDQLSQLYQFMFVPRLPTDYALQVVSGRDLNDYRYARSAGGALDTPLGRLDTQRYERIAQQPDQKGVSFWVAPERRNLPVQVRITEDGATLEQRLVRASIQD